MSTRRPPFKLHVVPRVRHSRAVGEILRALAARAEQSDLDGALVVVVNRQRELEYYAAGSMRGKGARPLAHWGAANLARTFLVDDADSEPD